MHGLCRRSLARVPKTNLLLVGCGKMGGALLARAAKTANIEVVDPLPPPAHLKPLENIAFRPAADQIPPAFKPDLIILAVKPQHMAEVLPAYARFKESVFLSIAAGVTIARLAALVGNEEIAIVRSMPNLPASIGQGMTVAVANDCVNAAQRLLCDQFLNAIGKNIWVEDEALLDAVAALSGSGPAYVFLLAEAMAKAGEALGLSSELAQELARHTIAGSGALLAQSKESAETLRRAVTSPGGTTEAALKHLLAADGLPALIMKAMKAAAKRSRELAQ